MSETSSDQPPKLTRRQRLLGLLPLVFFILHARYYWQVGGLPHLLWMCNIGNLVLAIGMFLSQPTIIRVAVIWFIPGLPLWLWFVVKQGGWILTSFLPHVGGLIVGLIALRKVRVSRWTWLHGFVWYLFVQEICRLFTPAELNVNVSHTIYGGFETMFSAYWQFWIVMSLLVAVGLWLVGLGLLKLFPPASASH